MIELEICANSLRSALNAKRGGATRIELCQDLASGGLTPSAGLIDYCVKQLQLQTRVLIRPRSGDFVYTADEVSVIGSDIDHCKQLGASAVVIGFLNHRHVVDTSLTRAMVQRAFPMEVTFHRAFDECVDPAQALEDIIACGCHKVLTAGGAPSAMVGLRQLQQLQQQAAGRIAIIAAAGITPDNVCHVLDHSGVDEIHASCKRPGDASLGSVLFPCCESVTDEQQVRQMVSLLKDYTR